MMRVFVAEGCPVVCERLVQLIDDQTGCRLAGASTEAAPTAAAIAAGAADLVLLGVMLADGSAFDLLRRLGETRGQSRYILLCDRLDAHYLYYARGLGVDYVLENPRDLDLVPALMEYLRRSPAGRRLPATEVR